MSPHGQRVPTRMARLKVLAMLAVFLPVYLQLSSASFFFGAPLYDESSSFPSKMPLSDASSKPLHSGPETLPLRLKVPFYVYENATLNWSNANWTRSSYEAYKHSDDWHLLQAAIRHPQRTRDPSKARLFFVPTLLNLGAALGRKRKFLCVGYNNETCFEKGNNQFFSYVDRVLGEQEWFQRNQGRDHVIVASHYNIGLYYGFHFDPESNTRLNSFPNLRRCNVISRQGERPIPSLGRFSLPSAYIGKACPWRSKSRDLVLVASLHKERPTFQNRRDICKWLSIRSSNTSDGSNEKKYSVSNCGWGEQCPALAKARFGFHVRGDTLGSNRVMDTLLSRTVPLFTIESQYDVLPPLVPWRNLTFLVPVNSSEAFYRSINDILSRPSSEYDRLLREVDKYMPIFDHTTIYRFDAYMAEFAKLQGFQKVGALW